MADTTVKVSNVSPKATEQEIKEFFSFSGDIVHVEMQSDAEGFQIAFVTFKDSQGAQTAILLSEATIADSKVIVALAPEYQLPPSAIAATEKEKAPGGAESAFRRAEDAVSGLLARGYVLGKDAMGKAKNFDEKHQLTSTASAKVASFDKRLGLTEKLSAGTTVVGGKVREVDQRYQVSEKTKSAFAAAEQTVSNAGSAIMKNRYVLTGTTWVAGTFSRVAKAAEEAGQKAKERAGMGHEEEKKCLDEVEKTLPGESPKVSDLSASKPPDSSESEQPKTKTEPAPAKV